MDAAKPRDALKTFKVIVRFPGGSRNGIEINYATMRECLSWVAAWGSEPTEVIIMPVDRIEADEAVLAAATKWREARLAAIADLAIPYEPSIAIDRLAAAEDALSKATHHADTLR